MADDTMSLLALVKFWLLLFLTIPSVICSIFIFIYFYQQKQKISLRHHLTLILTITSFLQVTTDILFSMLYYQRGVVISSTIAFCTWWNWWEYSLSGILLFTMAWGSIERHFLIFNNSFLLTKRRRIIFHYLPTFITCAYPMTFYLAVIVLNSCENQWNYDMPLCLIPCYMSDQSAVVTYDFMVDIVFPIVIITIANVSLILRVLWQKRRNKVAWRRQRKLTIQLLSIAALYIIFWFPLTINGLVTTFLPLQFLLDIQTNYFFFLIYMVPISLPFVSLINLSNIIKLAFKRRRTIIAPTPNVS